jgi:HEPN domain-containing protein
MMQLGRFRHNIELSVEYESLAIEDELTSRLLHDSRRYRHAMYLAVQAMEKYVRAKVFELIDGRQEFINDRNRHRNHSIEDAFDFLVEAISSDPIVREQIRKQLQENIIGTNSTEAIQFSYLHNNLRYPAYFERQRSFSMLEVGHRDSDLLLQRLDTLKKFLEELEAL